VGVDAGLRRAVFLDRDGVLNRVRLEQGLPRPPRGREELELLPGVPEALALLASRGLLLLVVTNQPDVARGSLERSAVEGVHAQLRAALPLDDVLACYHDDADACECRKPRPGLLLRAAARYGLDLRRSFMVGDRWKDVAAGHAAGCTTFLLDLPYSEAARCRPDHRAADLPQAARAIVDLLGAREAAG
jgi:D-glycero-D-manno-heptose 1,7-bisphosphate phosphatase